VPTSTIKWLAVAGLALFMLANAGSKPTSPKPTPQPQPVKQHRWVCYDKFNNIRDSFSYDKGTQDDWQRLINRGCVPQAQ
jgi:hypothetical protein